VHGERNEENLAASQAILVPINVDGMPSAYVWMTFRGAFPLSLLSG
jgi:hypothetical protein